MQSWSALDVGLHWWSSHGFYSNLFAVWKCFLVWFMQVNTLVKFHHCASLVRIFCIVSSALTTTESVVEQTTTAGKSTLKRGFFSRHAAYWQSRDTEQQNNLRIIIYRRVSSHGSQQTATIWIEKYLVLLLDNKFDSSLSTRRNVLCWGLRCILNEFGSNGVCNSSFCGM